MTRTFFRFNFHLNYLIFEEKIYCNNVFKNDTVVVRLGVLSDNKCLALDLSSWPIASHKVI